MKWISSTKVKIGGMIVAGTLVSGLGGAVLFNGVAHGEWSLDGLQQQVQYLTEKSDNHESRISNAENDIKNLQTTTSTTPAPSASPVPTVVTQPAPQVLSSTTTTTTSTVQPTPVPSPVPVRWEALWGLRGDGNCYINSYMLYYSDGNGYYSATQPDPSLPHTNVASPIKINGMPIGCLPN